MSYFPKASVVVPVYNGESVLEDCIGSLLRLNYPRDRVQLIFVDNRSTDRTAEILSRYQSQLSAFYESERGPAAARNRGLSNATGEVVAFTDADCVVDRDWLGRLVGPLLDDQIGVAAGRILALTEGNEIEKFGEDIHDQHKCIEVFEPPYAISMNWVSRLSVLREVDFFDPGLRRCEDVDLSYRIVRKGYRLVYAPDAVIHHRNENTLPGLFREGIAHGYYSVQLTKKHSHFLRAFGHSRIDIGAYLAIIKSLADYFRARDRERSRCYCVFNVGKKLGKALGSLRFLHLNL